MKEESVDKKNDLQLPRTGFGFDVHKLTKGNGIILGGITIPCDYKADGHSDADVLIHAICDALLGAASLNDIGYHFPDADPEYKDIESKLLLKKVCKMLNKQNYGIGNIDTTVGLQEPKIAPYIEAIRNNLSDILKIPFKDVSVKATTTEGLGFAGRKEGVLAYSSVLIYPRS